jgi:hypothetical protein
MSQFLSFVFNVFVTINKSKSHELVFTAEISQILQLEKLNFTLLLLDKMLQV